MLENIRDVPSGEVIVYQELALMMEAFATCFRRRVDAPLLWGGEFLDELVLYEELDGMFAQGSCSEGPNGRSLPFARGGGMIGGVLVHPWVEEGG